MTDCGRCPDRATRKGEINPHNSFYDVLIILKDRQHNFQQSSFFFFSNSSEQIGKMAR